MLHFRQMQLCQKRVSSPLFRSFRVFHSPFPLIWILSQLNTMSNEKSNENPSTFFGQTSQNVLVSLFSPPPYFYWGVSDMKTQHQDIKITKPLNQQNRLDECRFRFMRNARKNDQQRDKSYLSFLRSNFFIFEQSRIVLGVKQSQLTTFCQTRLRSQSLACLEGNRPK